MRKIILRHETFFLFACFVVSRLLVARSGVRFQYEALFTYWQYLDINSLQHRLIKSVWYLHAQPPVFNLLAGMVVQAGGGHARPVFQVLWLAMSFFNACLLLRLVKRGSPQGYLPLAIAGWYLFSPATILFENELFYTSFTSLLLLLSVYFIGRFTEKKGGFFVAGFFLSVTLLCLTRSIYHLAWLVAVCALPVVACYKKQGFQKVLAGSLLSVLLVSGWYVKNYLLFGIFSVSSWTGINFSRIVFHDLPVRDSATIAAIHPFLPVSYYKRYISAAYIKQYAGRADRVLLSEMKSDTAINMNNAGYLQVAEKYLQASKDFVRLHPAVYLKHAATSFIIFFRRPPAISR